MIGMDHQSPPVSDPPSLHLVNEAREHTSLLGRLLARYESAPQQIAATSNDRGVRRMRDWPIEGSCRYIVGRKGAGFSIVLAGTTMTTIFPANEGRLGGRIANSGAGSVTIWLASPGDAAAGLSRPLVFLPATAGGSTPYWDFKLSDVLWCGEVQAISSAGTTLVCAEL